MRIAMVGTGYVGLVTGTCLAETGNEVVCVDTNETKLKSLKAGQITIYEPHLEEIFQRNIKNGRLTFTADLKTAISDASVIMLALPTPPGEDGSADLSHVLGVASDIGKHLDAYAVIATKSTVPVGTAEKVTAAIGANAKAGFDVVSNPEFLREGHAVEDFMKPARIIIGSSSNKANEVLKELYEPFIRQGNPIYYMDERSAEMTKYAANTFLATKISFMNEIANLCELVGADVDKIRIGIGADDRIGRRFLFPGIGYGGSCFPKDVVALHRTASENGYDFEMIEAVMAVNERQRLRLMQKLTQFLGQDLKNTKVAIWGGAFKPDTDDIREAPTVYLVKELLGAGAQVSIYDPEAMDNLKAVFGSQLSYGNDQYDILDGAEAVVITTEWQVFRTPNFGKIKQLMKQPVIFDGRNLYEPERVAGAGFYYASMGRPVADGRQ